MADIDAIVPWPADHEFATAEVMSACLSGVVVAATADYQAAYKVRDTAREAHAATIATYAGALVAALDELSRTAPLIADTVADIVRLAMEDGQDAHERAMEILATSGVDIAALQAVGRGDHRD